MDTKQNLESELALFRQWVGIAKYNITFHRRMVLKDVFDMERFQIDRLIEQHATDPKSLDHARLTARYLTQIKGIQPGKGKRCGK